MKTIAFIFSAFALFTTTAQANFYSCSMLDRGICMEFDVSGVPSDEISKGEEECNDNGGTPAASSCTSGYNLSCEMQGGKAYIRFYQGFPQEHAQMICSQNGGQLK